MQALKERVFHVLEIPSPSGNRAGHAFDRVIVTLIVLNAAAVVLETVEPVAARYGEWLRAFEWLSLVVFAVEYALRVWSVTADPRFAQPVLGRLRFMATPYAIIDLLAILPALFVGYDLRVVRVLRLVRLLKLGRYSQSMQLFVNVVRDRARELLMSVWLVTLALLVMSSLMYYAERDAQPESFSSIPAAMWWGIVTLTTVGYGDVAPVTAAGKVIAGLTAIVGVGVIALPVGILASGFVEEINRLRQGRRRCPHCDGPLDH